MNATEVEQLNKLLHSLDEDECPGIRFLAKRMSAEPKNSELRLVAFKRLLNDKYVFLKQYNEGLREKVEK